MRTLKTALLACFLIIPTFAQTPQTQKRTLPIGKVTKARDAQSVTVSNDPLIIKVMTPIEHRVKKGENLYRIAKRYGVNIDEIRSAELNPRLANRKNKNLLRHGEVINIPVYKIKSTAQVELENTGFVSVGRVYSSIRTFGTYTKTPNDLVAMNSRDYNVLVQAVQDSKEKSKKIERLEDSVATARSWISIFTVMIIVLLALAGLLFYNLDKTIIEKRALRERLAEAEQETTNARNAAILPESPVDFIKLLEQANGNVLSLVADTPITYDEVGNPVTIKKIREFLTKRSYLKNATAKDWPQAMADHAQQTSE